MTETTADELRVLLLIESPRSLDVEPLESCR